jgi:hypothetical protein
MARLARSALLLAAAAAAALVLPPAASADSGTITVISEDAAGDLAFLDLSATVTKDTCDKEFSCVWHSFITAVAPGQPCTPDEIVSLAGVDAIHRTTGTFTDEMNNAAVARSTRLCLYLSVGADLPDKLVGQLDYQAPPDTPPPPTPDPPGPGTEPVPALTVTVAKRHVKPILKQLFKSRFTRRTGFHRSCVRRSATRVRCRVRWTHGRLRYAGALTIFAAPGEPHGVTYRSDIHKRRIGG